MRSPEDMKIIEIDITNACIHNCSNCTRMCGHYSRPFFMTWETFKRAVDSMDGYDGGVSIMGGEPTLHPEFERFAEYLGSKYVKKPKKDNYFIKPTKNFIRDRKLEERTRTYSYIEKTGDNVIGQRIRGPVLFSSLASNYYKYYESIQDIFLYQGINDHIIPCYHQPIGIMRKDMNISDDEWYKLRDACWIQNSWSASITPKGCFFCEIAGVLDMLFDGSGGWPIEKGWWKRKPEDFKDQLHWCEFCGASLNTRSRNANEEIDDVSKSFYEKLKQVNSPKLKNGKVNIYNIGSNQIDEGANRKSDYHKTNLNRVGDGNKTIYPSCLWGVMICNEKDTAEDIIDCIEYAISQMKGIVVFVGNNQYDNVKAKFSENQNIDVENRDARFGVNIAKANQKIGNIQYVLLFSSGIRLAKDFWLRAKKYVFNPGVIHYNYGSNESSKHNAWFNIRTSKDRIALYNTNSKALKRVGFDGVAKVNSFDEYINIWPDEKKLIFDDDLMKDREPVNELYFKEDMRYAVFGTGIYGKKAYEGILAYNGSISFFVDSNSNKWGKKIIGDIITYSPDALRKYRNNYDKAVIASISYNDMRKIMIENGLTDDDIIAPVF